MTKLTKPLIRLHNVETDEIIDREMNDEEYKLYLENQIKEDKFQFDIQIEKEAKAALLEKLGITEEEAKLLLGGN